MSEYVKTETCFVKKHIKELVLSLEEIFGKGTVEVHEQAQHLYGYQGDRRETMANVIVRRVNVNKISGGASNDLGFVFKPDGKVELQLSAFDRTKLKENNFLVPLKTEYNKLIVQKSLKLGGFTGIKTEVKNGKVVIRANKMGM